MTISKIMIYVTILAILLIIGVPTVYKVINNNYEKLYLVNEKLVVESASKCYYEGKCQEKTVTLKELYEYKYLQDDIIDPVTKVVYSHQSYVVLKKGESIFYSQM